MDGTPVTDIRNIGPATAAAFARAGLTTAEAIRAIGADAAYLRLLEAGERPHFVAYYVLVMGLQGRPWNDCSPAEKAALRKRFDALKAARSDPGASAREAALDALGVVPPKRQRGAEAPRARRAGPAQPTSSRPEKK
jgi:hypothetical protein